MHKLVRLLPTLKPQTPKAHHKKPFFLPDSDLRMGIAKPHPDESLSRLIVSSFLEEVQQASQTGFLRRIPTLFRYLCS